MEVEHFRMKKVIDWDLTVPKELTKIEADVVRQFLGNKRLGYIIMNKQPSFTELQGAYECTIEQINSTEVKLTHYTPIICKATN